MFTREEYENLINNSPLFEIDKESSPALYKTERYNFLTLLTEYYQYYIYPKKPLDLYCMTLMDTAVECIKYYKREKGDFLHLFNSSFKRNFHIDRAKEIMEEKRQGIKISGDDEKLISKIIALANSKGIDIYDKNVQNKLATAFNVKIEKLQQVIHVNDNAVAVSSTITNEDGDEIELYDLIASKEKSAEDKLIEDSSVILLIERIEEAFVKVQERQKKILSQLLTIDIIKAFNEDLDRVEQLLQGKQLFNIEVLHYCKTTGNLPTAKQIGKTCGVSEQSVSRTYKNFKEKLK